jgi:hypothetical protein
MSTEEKGKVVCERYGQEKFERNSRERGREREREREGERDEFTDDSPNKKSEGVADC